MSLLRAFVSNILLIEVVRSHCEYYNKKSMQDMHNPLNLNTDKSVGKFGGCHTKHSLQFAKQFICGQTRDTHVRVDTWHGRTTHIYVRCEAASSPQCTWPGHSYILFCVAEIIKKIISGQMSPYLEL